MSILSLRSKGVLALTLGLLALPAAAEESATAHVDQVCAQIDVRAHVESWEPPAGAIEGHWQVSGSIGDLRLDDGRWRALRRLEDNVLVEEILHGDSVVYRSLTGVDESGVNVIWTDVATNGCQLIQGSLTVSPSDDTAMREMKDEGGTVNLSYIPLTVCKDPGMRCDPATDCCPGHTRCPPSDECP